MPRYRKKPVVVEATQWEKNGDHPFDFATPSDIPLDIREGEVVRRFRRPDREGESRCDHCDWTMNSHGWIDTLEGGYVVCPGDYIITGIEGEERYPCHTDIFEATYEAVD